ncbi:MAG: hypothetical protein WAQ52_19880 [Terriglobales bacterium]
MIARWNTLLTVLLVLSASIAGARAAGPPALPPSVSFCDLLSNPQAFDSQWIQVHGHISVAFEDFSLREPGCDKPLTRNIWLAYGGDEATPTTYCCEDPSRAKGKDISVRGQSVPLIRDAPMEDFIAKVRARRQHRVNGQPCDGSLCNFYNVSATLVGLFLYAPNNPRNPLGGYGHLGCCHLLVIHRVSDVMAERTPVPSDDVSFTCLTQAWQAEFPRSAGVDLLDPQVANKKFLAQQMREHGDADLVETMRNTISKYAGITGTLAWTSPDLQTIYSAAYPQGSPKKKKKRPDAPPPTTITVSRERCAPIPENRQP